MHFGFTLGEQLITYSTEKPIVLLNSPFTDSKCLYLYSTFLVLMSTQSTLQHSVTIHLFTHTFIQCIYVQHFVYYTSFILSAQPLGAIWGSVSCPRNGADGDRTADLLVTSHTYCIHCNSGFILLKPVSRANPPVAMNTPVCSWAKEKV